MTKLRARSLAILMMWMGVACGHKTPEEVVARHIVMFTGHNWDAVLEDYADDAVFIGPNVPIEGKKDLREFFKSLDRQSPPLTFKETPVKTRGDIAAIDWIMNSGTSGALRGRDIFVIRAGKIVFQSTIGVKPENAE
jgi:ketosteroid isomerase-like protein